MTGEQKDILCIANREKNAGFSMRKPRKLTGESWRRDENRQGVGVWFPTSPNAACLSQMHLLSCQGMDYELRVHICPQEIINAGESFCGCIEYEYQRREGISLLCSVIVLEFLNGLVDMPFSILREKFRAFKCHSQGHGKSERGVSM